MTDVLKIRAHHLLCVQGFQGYGYNQDFVKNLSEVVKNIDSNPLVEVVAECDIICSFCPHNLKGSCHKEPDSAQKVKDMDMQVLKKININIGTRSKIKDLLSLVNKKTINICGDCSWKEQCLRYNPPQQ